MGALSLCILNNVNKVQQGEFKSQIRCWRKEEESRRKENLVENRREEQLVESTEHPEELKLKEGFTQTESRSTVWPLRHSSIIILQPDPTTTETHWAGRSKNSILSAEGKFPVTEADITGGWENTETPLLPPHRPHHWTVALVTWYNQGEEQPAAAAAQCCSVWSWWVCLICQISPRTPGLFFKPNYLRKTVFSWR